MIFIAGDVGGTKVRLGCYEEEEGELRCLREEKYASRNFSDFATLLDGFLKGAEGRPIAFASFGIAGPVKDEVCNATNLPWIVSARELEKKLGIPRVFLINDLEANAWGISCLKDHELFTINTGEQSLGNRALISVGTGLGEAGFYWDGKKHHPFACEGGHCDFGPTNEDELELYHYLKKQNPHVSYERPLSGNGLYQIYKFLVSTGREKENPEITPQLAEPQRFITEKALRKECPACIRTCQMFISIYGSEAGNLALKFFAIGGIYIGGGVAPSLAPLFNEEQQFMRAFVDKGRLSSLLIKIPVRVVLNDKTALLGAIRYGQEKSR